MSLPPLKPWTPRTQPPSVWFINANIVDVKKGEIMKAKSVRISKGKVVQLDNVGNETSGGNEVVVDLGGQYFLCPGLIDCHVHLTANSGQATMRDLFAAHPNAIAYRTAWNAKQMLLRGFTTVRDTAGADSALRDAITEGLVHGPRLFIAGKALSQTGGHGDLRAVYQGDESKCCGGHTPGLGRICDGVPACLEAARDELRKGADFLKIMVGGGVASPSDPLDMLQFTAEEIQAITTTARQMGKYVTAHAYTVDAIRHAIDNGVMGIEHGNFIDRETAKLCAEKGVTITPTLVTYKAMSEPPYEDFLPPDGQVKNKRVLDSGVRALNILHESGVQICFGTDLLAGMHALQNEEFSIRNEVLSAGDILRSAIVNAARLLSCELSLGQIAEGFFADLLILNKNPLEDITVLDRIKETCYGILKDGRVVVSRIGELKVDELYC
jgi:imidazolonepropionase-like amidohydrolase